MFIDNSRYDLTNKITVDSHDLLQAGPRSSAGGHPGLPRDVDKQLHEGTDQGHLFLYEGNYYYLYQKTP